MRDWPEAVDRRYDRAVFLDRDGTINVDTHFPHRVEDFAFLEGSAEGLRILASLPVAVIVVSNQAGIAKGLYPVEAMSAFNLELRRRVEEAGGRIDAFYYCPELEPKDLPPGARPSPCSKPEPGMLLEAAADFGLDPGRSFVIGDKSSDIEAGRRAGCTTLLVLTGKAGREEGAVRTEPDHVVSNLLAAAHLVRRLLSVPAKAV